MIDTIALWAAHFYIRLGIMRVWSNIYAWIWERKTQAPLPRFIALNRLSRFIATLKWRPDTWRELGDAISSIGAISWRALNEPKKLIGDCDEFGRFAACAIRNELAHDPTWDPDIDTTYLLTVMWKRVDYKTSYGGHNVCLIHYKDGTWAYMDYGDPHQRHPDIAGVVKEIRDRYAEVYEPLGYAWSDPWTLKMVGISRE